MYDIYQNQIQTAQLVFHKKPYMYINQLYINNNNNILHIYFVSSTVMHFM